jgi:hypothetical protein
VPRPDAGAVIIRDVANAFLNHERALPDAGELSPGTWGEYKEACDLLAGKLGVQPQAMILLGINCGLCMPRGR